MQNQKRILLKSEKDCNKFHSAMRLTIKLAQIFSFFPVNGINDSSQKSVKFTWISWKILYSCTILILFLANFVVLIYVISKKGLNMDHVGFLMFYLEAILLKISFLKLASEWPTFIHHWCKCETSMKHYDIAENMTKYTNKVASTILLLAFAEHNILTYNKMAISFKRFSNVYDIVEDYSANISYWDVFSVTQYSIWKGMICQILNWQRTFIWTYSDVFLITIGISFNFKLKQIKQRIRNMVLLNIRNPILWRRVREDYVQLEELFVLINSKLSWIIVVSFSANMYFILIQLYKLIRDTYTQWELIYLLISFTLLVGRLTCVCYYGGVPTTQTMAILKALNSVGSSAYNSEMGTAIMAYELVLTQFSDYSQ